MSIIEASALLDIAISAWRESKTDQIQHLEAALTAAGNLQRALLVERLSWDMTTAMKDVDTHSFSYIMEET